MKKNSDSKNNSIITPEASLPEKLTIIPLVGRPIFPGIFTPLMVNNTNDAKSIENAFMGDGFIGIVLAKSEGEAPKMEDLYEVGTAARIIKKINLPDGGLNVFVSTIKRFKITKTLSKSDPMVAAVEYLDDQETDTFEVKALSRALVTEMKEISENNPMFSEEMRLNMANIDNPGKVADFVASILNIEKEEQQKVLETLNVRQRMEKVLVFIKKEQEILKVQKKIQNEINEKVEKNQRDYFLREELKSIQEELGISGDGRSADVRRFKRKIDAFHFTGEIAESVNRELEKFSLLDPRDADYNVSRTYLDTVCSLPWNDPVIENFNMEEAKKILEDDHYGLDDVKKRIYEFMAVRKFKADSKGTILILSGPPGVGKTSIGKSIARAMNKPFYRFSVGGERDTAAIKGHRRTYVGALPGQIIQGFKIVKSKSPVFMIDEVDKMTANAQGDPAAALLEVLDPEQNVSFRDSYLDLPFDVSNALFILTANTLDSIPQPLKDRAEIISLTGYIDQEKIEIARKYLLPKNLEKNGLSKNQISFTKGAFSLIASEYAREAGVRNFEKCIDKINRKIILELLTEYDSKNPVQKKTELLDVNPDHIRKEIKMNLDSELKKGRIEKSDYDLKIRRIESAVEEKVSEAESENLKIKKALADEEREKLVRAFSKRKINVGEEEVRKYLGRPVFDESQIKTASVPGTAIGLAWTSMGGDTLLIESISFPTEKAGGLVLTGQMGDVMKESAQIAMNWVKEYSISRGIKDSSWFEKNTIHLHIPEGATPKDGPSAGITMATTLLSLLKGKKIKPNLAMTGELSLTGQVLPIGGLREKTVAAKRNKIKTILIPNANVRDLEEIPENVKKGIKFIPVSRAEDVMEIVF